MKRKVVNLSLSVICCMALMLLMILPIGPFIDVLWVLQPWGGIFMLVVEFNNSILTLLFLQKFINVGMSIFIIVYSSLFLLGRFGYGT